MMFGMPVMLRVPDVIGVRLTGALREGTLATDLALAVTERLRQDGAFRAVRRVLRPRRLDRSRRASGPASPTWLRSTARPAVTSRSMGKLSGIWATTGRTPEHIQLVEDYTRRQGLWFDPEAQPRYTEVVDLDLSAVTVSVAGPRRPQDRLTPERNAAAIARLRDAPLPAGRTARRRPMARWRSPPSRAAPTPPTLASSWRPGCWPGRPGSFGFEPPAWVKTSLTPGSPTAERYLRRAGLMDDLEAMGFSIAGYGCATCIGNSGALTAPIIDAVRERDILPVVVLSGNRNFPGRVHPTSMPASSRRHRWSSPLLWRGTSTATSWRIRSGPDCGRARRSDCGISGRPGRRSMPP